MQLFTKRRGGEASGTTVNRQTNLTIKRFLSLGVKVVEPWLEWRLLKQMKYIIRPSTFFSLASESRCGPHSQAGLPLILQSVFMNFSEVHVLRRDAKPLSKGCDTIQMLSGPILLDVDAE
jgi:hypothetical protein